MFVSVNGEVAVMSVHKVLATIDHEKKNKFIHMSRFYVDGCQFSRILLTFFRNGSFEDLVVPERVFQICHWTIQKEKNRRSPSS